MKEPYQETHYETARAPTSRKGQDTGPERRLLCYLEAITAAASVCFLASLVNKFFHLKTRRTRSK